MRAGSQAGSRSLRLLTPRGRAARARLFCVPYAGAGAYVFRSWVDELPHDVELQAVQLPGREDRIGEEPSTDMRALVEALAREVEPFLDLPFAVFGHSLGALIAAELSLELQRTHGVAPDRLLVSGSRALHLVNAAREPVHTLSDAELVQHIRALNGTPEAILQDAAMMRFVLRLVRADYALFDGYTHVPGTPLSAPVTVLGGESDGTTDAESLGAWAELSPHGAQVHMFPGDHFFIRSARSEVLALVSRELADLPDR